METILHIPINTAAAIACDVSAATDTPNERLDEYRQLFTRALLSVERQPGGVEFRFAAKPGIREWTVDLAAREAACCPFLGYHLTADPDAGTVTWTTTGNETIEAVRAFLDMFQDAPVEFLKTPGELACVVAQRGFVFVDEDGAKGFEFEPAHT